MKRSGFKRKAKPAKREAKRTQMAGWDMNEPADIVKRLYYWLRQRELSSDPVVFASGDVTTIRKTLKDAADLIERLSSAPVKDEFVSPREAPSDEVSESAVERADQQLHQVLLRMALRVEGGRENVAIGQYFAKEIVAACSMARAIISALQKATGGEPRGETNSSPVADTEAMEAARRIKDDVRNHDEEARMVARALLAREGAREAVTRPMIEFRQELREKREAELRAAVIEECAKVVDDEILKVGHVLDEADLQSLANLAATIRALGARKEQG